MIVASAIRRWMQAMRLLPVAFSSTENIPWAVFKFEKLPICISANPHGISAYFPAMPLRNNENHLPDTLEKIVYRSRRSYVYPRILLELL